MEPRIIKKINSNKAIFIFIIAVMTFLCTSFSEGYLQKVYTEGGCDICDRCYSTIYACIDQETAILQNMQSNCSSQHYNYVVVYYMACEIPTE